MNLLKNLFYPIVITLFIGCNLSASNKQKQVAEEDSLEFYPSTPKQISKAEFRNLYNRLKHYFDSTLLKKGFNGQILVAKNGAIVFDKVTGFADFRTKDSLTANTPMHIASAGKTFTGMALLHLQETGRLTINDTLNKFFPDFPYPNITIKMLLSHRSGLPNYLYYLAKLKVRDTCYSNEDVLNSLYTLKPRLEFPSGKRFSYSNTNYVLLALIVEKVTGESFPAFMKRVFFDPLQMSNTFIATNNDTLKITPSFQWNGRYYPTDQYDCTYGDKNLYSTSYDLLKWDQALYGGQLFKQETLDSAYMPLSNERPSVHNYGLGWRMMNFKHGKKIIYHNGRWHGCNASFVRLPEENATIIVIGNKFSWKIYSAAMKASNIFGNYYPGVPIQPEEGEDDFSDNTSIVKAITLPQNDNPLKTRR